MNEGSGLLWIALILTTGAVAALSAFVLTGTKTYRKLARILLVCGFIVLSATFFLMISYFLTSNMAVSYVYSNSRTDYPWYYKLAGAWAGDDGSLLLWSWLLSLCTLVFFMERKKDSPPRASFRSLTSVVLLVILAAFIFVLITADPFRPTAPMLLVSQGESNGLGMSPLLQTPLVIIHPPLEFAAYALLVVPFAGAAAYLLQGKGQWTRLTMQWTRAAWLFLTLAIIIGALWAYTVLGWGGYWAWDPVETTNLAVWLPLTALVHSALWNRRKAQYSRTAPMLAAAVFALALFATIETRTGIITSVHSFTGSIGAGNSLGDRLLAVLSAGGPVAVLFAIMAISLLATAALFMRHFIRLRHREGAVAGAMTYIPWIFLIAFALASIWAILDISGFTKTVLDLAGWLSLGYGALGLVILAGVFVGIPLLWMILTSPAGDESRGGLKEWVSDDGAMNVGLALFILWTLVTIALMIIGANALNPQDFEARLPYLLVPVGMALFAGLTWRFFTKEWTPYAILILGFAVIVSYAIFSSNVGAVYLPIVVGLAFAAGLRIYRTWTPALLTPRLRLAAMLILISLLLAFLMWGAGLSAVGIPFVFIPSSLGLSFACAFFSLATMILLAFAISRKDIRLWLASAIAGVALLGFLIGSVLSIVAIALILTSRREFAKGAEHRRISITSIIRGASPQLVHLGVALLVLGYAASTYFASEQQVMVHSGVPGYSSTSYKFSMLSSNAADTNGDGSYDVVSADVEVSRFDAHLFIITLKMSWRTEGVGYAHYLSDPAIHSGPTGDLYFIFLGFEAGGSQYLITDSQPALATNNTISAIAFQLRENPMMVPLWGGAWLMATGMVIRMWSERGLYRTERPEEILAPAAEPPKPRPPAAMSEDDYYKRLLEEELQTQEDPK